MYPMNLDHIKLPPSLSKNRLDVETVPNFQFMTRDTEFVLGGVIAEDQHVGGVCKGRLGKRGLGKQVRC